MTIQIPIEEYYSHYATLSPFIQELLTVFMNDTRETNVHSIPRLETKFEIRRGNLIAYSKLLTRNNSAHLMINYYDVALLLVIHKTQYYNDCAEEVNELKKNSTWGFTQQLARVCNMFVERLGYGAVHLLAEHLPRIKKVLRARVIGGIAQPNKGDLLMEPCRRFAEKGMNFYMAFVPSETLEAGKHMIRYAPYNKAIVEALMPNSTDNALIEAVEAYHLYIESSDVIR